MDFTSLRHILLSVNQSKVYCKNVGNVCPVKLTIILSAMPSLIPIIWLWLFCFVFL